MGVDAGLYMYDVVVKSSRSLSHLLMSSCSMWRPSAILHFVKSRLLVCVYGWEGQCASVIMQNLMAIGQAVAQIWRFFDLSKWRPSTILDFINTKFYRPIGLGSKNALSY